MAWLPAFTGLREGLSRRCLPYWPLGGIGSGLSAFTGFSTGLWGRFMPYWPLGGIMAGLSALGIGMAGCGHEMTA